MADPTPHLTKRVLGRMLKELRLQAVKTQEDVARANVCVSSTLRAIENGITQGAVKQGTVADLLDLYGIGPGETRDYLKGLAADTKRKGWYSQRKAKSFQRNVMLLLDIEQIASRITGYEESYVPGCFQTADYMRASARNLMYVRQEFQFPDFDELIMDRLKRNQMIIKRLNEGMKAHYIIGFPALMQQMGSRKVMAQQIQVLRELDNHPNLTLSVLPPTVGAHACQRKSLTILEFDNPRDPTVIYEEGGSQPATYLDSPESEVKRHLLMLQDTAGKSLPLKRYLDEN